MPDFGDDETEVQDDPMDTSEDPPEEVKQEGPDNPASAVMDLDIMNISADDEDYSMISSQYSMVSAAPEVMSLASEDSALNTDVLKSRYELLLDEGWEPIWQCGRFQGLAKETANGNEVMSLDEIPRDCPHLKNLTRNASAPARARFLRSRKQ